MKTKNLKKLILLGLTSLLTANFSVCAMESDSEDKNEININTDKTLSDDEDLFGPKKKSSDDESINSSENFSDDENKYISTEKNLSDDENINNSKNFSDDESINNSENFSDDENIDIENIDQIMNKIKDMDPWDNFNYLSARNNYIYEKKKYEQMKKIYERLDKENINRNTEKYMYDVDKNCEDYKKIIDYLGFNNKPEKKGSYKDLYHTYYNSPSYKSNTFKKLDEAINLIKDINHSNARSLIDEIKYLRKKVSYLIGNKFFDDKIFAKHFTRTLKTICCEAKYCLNYLEKTTGIKISEKELAKKFLEFLKKLEEKHKSYDYWPDENKIKERFDKYQTAYKDSGIWHFVIDLGEEYGKLLKEIIDKTYSNVKKGKGKEAVYIRHANKYAKGNVYDNGGVPYYNSDTFDPEYDYKYIELLGNSLSTEILYEKNIDMISEFLDNLVKTASYFRQKKI